MARKFFVTGIDTNVGKTIVSATLTETLKADYWKPIQTGTEHDTPIVQKLISNNQTKFHKEVYCLKEPLSPHAAAKLENKQIDFDSIQLPKTENNLIIEGAGGLLVPLNEKYFVIDLIQKFDAEVILVVKHYLGSINHTMLSIEALRHRNINLLGVIINGEENKLSEEIILQAGVRILGRVEQEQNLTPKTIQKYESVFSAI